jgi:hypothetical protein
MVCTERRRKMRRMRRKEVQVTLGIQVTQEVQVTLGIQVTQEVQVTGGTGNPGGTGNWRYR